MERVNCFSRLFLAQFARGPDPIDKNLARFDMPAILWGKLLYQSSLFQHTVHYPKFIQTIYRWTNQAVMALSIHAFYPQPELGTKEKIWRFTIVHMPEVLRYASGLGYPPVRQYPKIQEPV